MPPAAKASLAAEILAAYALARWMMPRRDIRQVVQAVRGQRRERPRPRALGPKPIAHQDTERTTQQTAHTAARLGCAVTRTLRVLPTDSRCLVQALVLSRLLSERGIPSTLVIGARSQPGFTAHAWVEHAGRPVLTPAGFDEARLVEL